MRKLKNDRRPQAKIVLDGDEFPLLIDMQALMDIEDHVAPSNSIYQLARGLMADSIGIAKQAAFYRICIEAGYRSLGSTPAEAKTLTPDLEWIVEAILSVGARDAADPMIELVTDACKKLPKPENMPPKPEGDAPGETEGDLAIVETTGSPSTSPSDSGPDA